MALETHRRTFISYSRVNKEFAVKLAKKLRSDGVSIWFDQLDIPTGSRWDDELEKALHECGVFLVILTPDSIASENVKDEIGFAIDNNKRILPVLLENCNIPLRLRRFQYVDFTTKNYDEGVQSAKELLEVLASESTTPRVRDVSPKEEVAAVEPNAEAKAEIKPKLASKPKAESEAKVKEKPAPIKASAPVAEKKSSRTGLVIGIVAVLVLVFGGIGYGLSTANPPATKAKAAPTKTPKPAVEEAPAATEILQVSEEYIPAGPLTNSSMSTDEARTWDENTKRFATLGRETYGDETFFAMRNSGNAVYYVENSTLEPLVMSGADCAITQELVDANYTNWLYTVELNGETLSNDSFSYYSSSYNDGTNDWFCWNKVMVIGNWQSGQQYSVRDTSTVLNAYSDGINNWEPGVTYTREFIITIP